MASVHLMFSPPDEPLLASLHIEESVLSTGPWTEIEEVTAIGSYPEYITEYTTTLASDSSHWFRIVWEDTKGALSQYSQAWQGGTSSLVAEIVRRVRERESGLDQRVIVQEAEAAIQMQFGADQDPYDPTLTASYRVMNGLAYYVLARCLIVAAVTSETGGVESATLGLVSFKSSSTSSQTTRDVQALIDLANKELGIATSFVLQLEDITCQPYITADFSRLVSGWLTIDA